VGAMQRKGKEEDFRSNLHRGGTAKLIQLSQQWRQTALVAAEAMGLSIAGVDLLQSKRGPLVLEVNSSPGLQGIENATKKDIAGIMIDFVAQKASQLNNIQLSNTSSANALIH